MTTDPRTELTELLEAALGTRATELLMSELDDNEPERNLEAQFSSFTSHTDQEFAHIRDRFAEVDTRLTDVNTRLTDVNTRLTDVNTRLTDVNTRLDDVNTRLDDVNTRLTDVNTRLTGVDRRFDDVDHRFDLLTERIDLRYAQTEALVLREIGTMRGELVTQTRTLMIGIPSMVGAIALLVLGFVQFAIAA